jgi:hypothetical protein
LVLEAEDRPAAGNPKHLGGRLARPLIVCGRGAAGATVVGGSVSSGSVVAGSVASVAWSIVVIGK